MPFEIIRAVGPVWADGSRGEEAMLRRTYDSAPDRRQRVQRLFDGSRDAF